ncbi:MAG: UDP-N-acetylmuramoyl-tripeptide--D-alanyl-D-alanine ligase [Armatimonadetes bacterium]|nr:UDP-N-acetylmuramoyl-tripeptide--D-alanyl-D-alanine ligase [Armatimonadota bacterium]
MLPLKVKEILESTSGKLIKGNKEEEIFNFSTDTRALKKGDFFIPLAGENFDGHNFIKDAVLKEAQGILFSREIEKKKFNILIQVPDTKIALMRIAGFYRNKFSFTSIGVTGSNGKTTTKDLISHILKRKYLVLKSQENFNNEIGISKTLLKLNPSYQIGVFELAMRAPGEIKELAKIIKPEIAVITNIGESHLEFMKSKKIIAKSKAEILESLPPNGLAVLPKEDYYFKFLSSFFKGKIISFGLKSGNIKLIKFKNLFWNGYKFKVEFKNEVFDIELPLLGKHNILNALAAIITAKTLGMENDEIRESLLSFKLSSKRMEKILLKNEIILINDAYNASPASMRSALAALASLRVKGRKIAILGDMKELGKIEKKAHLEIGKFVRRSKFNLLITVGLLGELIARGAKEAGFLNKNIFICKNKQEALNILLDKLKEKDLILIKGSRKMQLEEIADYLIKRDKNVKF